MEKDPDAEILSAAELLRAWADGDFDGFADALDFIAETGDELAEHLREFEGDARGIQDDLTKELARLAGLVRGALYLTRHAIDLALDPPATRFLSRGEILNKLAEERQPPSFWTQ
jgi:hypothetical protein